MKYYKTMKTSAYWGTIYMILSVTLLLSVFYFYIYQQKNLLLERLKTFWFPLKMLLVSDAFYCLYIGIKPIWAIISEKGVGYKGFYKPRVFIQWDQIVEVGIGHSLKNKKIIYISTKSLADTDNQKLDLMFSLSSNILIYYYPGDIIFS